jgi:hypothetical protein
MYQVTKADAEDVNGLAEAYEGSREESEERLLVAREQLHSALRQVVSD